MANDPMDNFIVMYDNNDDGIWIMCGTEGCEWDENLGYTPTIAALRNAALRHTCAAT